MNVNEKYSNNSAEEKISKCKTKFAPTSIQTIFDRKKKHGLITINF